MRLPLHAPARAHPLERRDRQSALPVGDGAPLLGILQLSLLHPKEHLYSRDKRFMPDLPGFQALLVEKSGTKVPCLEKNGRKMFWSRGNSWVLAGLARLMDDLPAHDPGRRKFAHRFQELAARILELQPTDGLWRMGLLDPEAYPHGEASGTAFFTFAFAWGIEHHLLDRTTYLPALEKSWAALLAVQKPDGMLGYVQRIGAAPDNLSANDAQEYGTGALLLAGAEWLKLTNETGGGGNPNPRIGVLQDPGDDLATPPRVRTVKMEQVGKSC
ncbi:MAG: glycoside hydrolase family 88 protein, partial [Chthoniobacteraceae bacterium]